MLDKPVSTRCLFVHGWAMNQRIWQPLVDNLPDWIDPVVIDLPGHGSRSHERFSDLQNLKEDLLVQVENHRTPDQAFVLVAWSLGALPCLSLLAENKLHIDGLFVVSSNPCFVTRPDWGSGINSEVFDQFAKSLKADFSGTIRRFLSLQVKGSESGRAILRELREKVLQQAEPDGLSLDAGLEILKTADLRDQLQQINKPVSWALGAQDGLVNAELAIELEVLMRNEEIKIYDKAGHAPFLSHTDEFLKQLTEFVAGITKER